MLRTAENGRKSHFFRKKQKCAEGQVRQIQQNRKVASKEDTRYPPKEFRIANRGRIGRGSDASLFTKMAVPEQLEGKKEKDQHRVTRAH